MRNHPFLPLNIENHAMSYRLFRIAGVLLIMMMLVIAPSSKAAAAQDSFQFGDRTLSIPRPPGFEPISAIAPAFMQRMQEYNQDSRLVEAYATPSDVKVLATGKIIGLYHSIILHVMNKHDGVLMSEKDFHDYLKVLEGKMIVDFKSGKVDEKIAKEDQQGNTSGAGSGLRRSGHEYLGVYRREPWGLFFTTEGHVSTTDQSNRTVVTSSAAILVNQQVLLLSAGTEFRDENDRKWAEQTVSAWADAIRKANLGGHPIAVPKNP